MNELHRLFKFLKHTEGCDAWVNLTRLPAGEQLAPCTCSLDATLKALGAWDDYLRYQDKVWKRSFR